MGFKANVNQRPPHKPAVPVAQQVAAVCTRVIDLGTQNVQDFGDVSFSLKRQVHLAFELPEFRVKDKEGNDKAAMLSSVVTLSFDKKAKLTKILRAMGVEVPKSGEVDLETCIGRGLCLDIEHSDPKPDGSVWEKIVEFGRLGKGEPIPKMETKPIVYTVEGLGGEFVMPPQSIPEFLRAKILECQEAKGTRSAPPSDGEGGPKANDGSDVPW